MSYASLLTLTPVPVDAMGTPGWNMTAWRERHTPAMVDSIIESTIASMRGELGVKKIGAVGYWYVQPLICLVLICLSGASFTE